MKKLSSFLVSALVLLILVPTVFAFRFSFPITLPPISVAPEPGEWDYITPQYLDLKLKAKKWNAVNYFDGLDMKTNYTQFRLSLKSYEGSTRIYRRTAIYIKGKLKNGNNYLASVVLPEQDVTVYNLTKKRVYFRAAEAQVTIFINDVKVDVVDLTTVRIDIYDKFGGILNGVNDRVNIAGGTGGEFSDDYFRVTGLKVYSFDWVEI